MEILQLIFFPLMFGITFALEFILGKRWLKKLIPPFLQGPDSPQYFGVIRKILDHQLKSPARFIFFAGLVSGMIVSLVFWDLMLVVYGAVGTFLGTFSAYFIHNKNAQQMLGVKSGRYREILFHRASGQLLNGKGEAMDKLRENLVETEVLPACKIMLEGYAELKHTHPNQIPEKMLVSQNPEIRLLAAGHLLENAPQTLASHFSALLDDPFLPVRRFAWRILPTQSPEKAMIAAKAGLESLDPEIRKDAKAYLETRPDWLESQKHIREVENAKQKAKEKALETIKKVVNLPQPIKVAEIPETQEIPKPLPAPTNSHLEHDLVLEEDLLDFALRKVDESSYELRRQVIGELKTLNLAFDQVKSLLFNPQASLAEDALVLLPSLLDWQDPKVVTAYREYPHRVVREKALDFLAEYWGGEDRREVLRGIIEVEKPLDQVETALFWIKRLGDKSFWSLILEKNRKWEKGGSADLEGYQAWKLSRAAEEALSAILQKNGLLDRNKHGVFCRNCLTFGTFVRTEIWDHLVCRTCKTVENLHGPLREVVGVIGPGFEVEWQDRVVEVDLWNEEKQEFRYADMDTLEIRGGGAMDYDWAVNAVLEGWMNRRGGGLPDLKVRLTGKPKLSANSRKLLEKIKLSSDS